MNSNSAALLGVIGDPVLHSRSPQMMRAALRAVEFQGNYLWILANKKNFAATIKLLPELSFRGINITAPFKELETAQPRNTLVWGKDTASYNTDVEGVRRCIGAYHPKHVLILGAGGAAVAAISAARQLGATVSLWNRTAERGEELARKLHCTLLAASELNLCAADTVISTLPANASIPDELRFRPAQIILDAIYDTESRVAARARADGARLLSGNDWLLYQGAEAFRLFTGLSAPIEVMRSALATPPAIPRAISFIGMPGSGKTTLAQCLAEKLSQPLISIDEEICRHERASIPEIFATKGESYFRDLEAQMIQKFVSFGGILDCGGGAVLRPSTQSLLHEKTLCLWLATSPEIIAERLNGKRHTIAVASLPQLSAERLPFYASTAHAFLESGTLQPDELANIVYSNLHALHS